MKLYTLPLGMLQTNCYIVASEQNHAAIIDPGADAQSVVRALATLGLEPRLILLTHAHYDHIGAVKELREDYPQLQVMLGEEDLDMYTDPERNLGARFGEADRFTGLTWDRALRDGDTVELDEITLRVLHTPGHTKGGVCYVGDGVLFSGDTLFRREVGRTDLYGGSFDAIKASVARLYTLEGDYQVYPGHGDATTLEDERKNNPYVRG